MNYFESKSVNLLVSQKQFLSLFLHISKDVIAALIFLDV